MQLLTHSTSIFSVKACNPAQILSNLTYFDLSNNFGIINEIGSEVVLSNTRGLDPEILIKSLKIL